MVLTDRQRVDLHAGIYEYLCSQGPAFQKVAEAFAEADPTAAEKGKAAASSGGATSNGTSSSNALHVVIPATRTTTTPLLEKKWTAIPRLQKKVLELERQAAHNAKIHAHRGGGTSGGGANSTDGMSSASGPRRMLPRLPCSHTLQGHSSVVTCVQVHPLFTIVVSGSEDGTVKVWDHESGEYIRTLKGHTNTVNAVAFSPTGSHMASCSTDLSIKLWDFSDYVCLRTLRGHDHTISSVIFLPQESAFAEAMMSSSNGGRNSTTSAASTSGGKSAIAATAGAQCLLSASRDQTVKLWDIETGFCDHTYTDHGDWVRCLAGRHSDGGIWASAGNDPMICVYDYKTKIAELRGHEHVVEALAFITEEPFKESGAAALSSSSSNSSSPTNASAKQNELLHDYLASGSRDRTVRLWRVSEQTCLAVFRAHENWVRSVLIHPSGNYIISSSDDKSIRVFDIKAVRCLRTLDNAHDHFISSLHMHHTLPILVSGSVDQTVRCWQLD